MKSVFFILLLVFNSNVLSADRLVSNANVTSLKVYETNDDSVNVWMVINGSGRIGPNPDNPAVTCELWTKSSSVHGAALAALMSKKKVNIWYVDRGDKSHWCKVKLLEVLDN
ncbi:hypothetical protein PRUB_b0778 [Pseudoalteromonas rubra]|uniref:Uncharacterized protein n=1 Tax=Pseudoalteromonas rubra TaxID=43658 RepID=A0A8T0C2G2_9GAMM|nr:DUF5992 family protein [Pseudoalteromonas rubra]KAF7781527.1 hypothetical protein PRUB_b0778 [Pseudoalteromonas rubra]